jgi:hypothetical protein
MPLISLNDPTALNARQLSVHLGFQSQTVRRRLYPLDLTERKNDADCSIMEDPQGRLRIAVSAARPGAIAFNGRGESWIGS